MAPLVDLDGAATVVTGGASGIGAAVVRTAQALGAHVAVVDLGPAPDADIALRADVSRSDEASDAVAEAASRLGGLDVLVNNAGVAPPGTLTDTTDEAWRQTLAVNLDGTFFCTRAAEPLLADGPGGAGGSVVNVASIAGRSFSRTAGVAYAASKGGVIALTRQLGVELAGRGIRVNCVCPGLVDTAIMTRNTEPARLAELVASVPMGRLGTADEIAALICFLASPAASYLTGSVVDVNGGVA